MKVTVAGIGYVGVVSAACLARDGHQVFAVDVNADKVRALQEGRPPIVEPGLEELVREVVLTGHLQASMDLRDAVSASDMTLVCVGTPSRTNGDLDTSHVAEVTRQIGAALREVAANHTVVYRSTMLPGTTEDLLIPILEESSGKRMGEGFVVCVNPEYLREGSALDDYANPGKTVIGGAKEHSALVSSLYDGIEAPTFVVPIRHAELSKYVDNAWHALKIAFANEIGSICGTLGLDSHEVMNIFAADGRLNISKAYLKPGFAFGGSCLPKDLRALNYRARGLDLRLPVLASILESNDAHLDRVKAMIAEQSPSSVGLLGLAFKSGTDDLRESPSVALVEWLVGKGVQVSIHDAALSLAEVTGSNRSHILDRVPHVAELLRANATEVAECSDVVVVASTDCLSDSGVVAALKNKHVIDLVHIGDLGVDQEHIHGVCW